jgi:hypothetical protein
MRTLRWMIVLASLAFGSERRERFVFCLMDSAFKVQARMESEITSACEPDSSQVLDSANAKSDWRNARRKGAAKTDGGGFRDIIGRLPQRWRVTDGHETGMMTFGLPDPEKR